LKGGERELGRSEAAVEDGRRRNRAWAYG